jgi:hypothetical protein
MAEKCIIKEVKNGEKCKYKILLQTHVKLGFLICVSYRNYLHSTVKSWYVTIKKGLLYTLVEQNVDEVTVLFRLVTTETTLLTRVDLGPTLMIFTSEICFSKVSILITKSIKQYPLECYHFVAIMKITLRITFIPIHICIYNYLIDLLNYLVRTSFKLTKVNVKKLSLTSIINNLQNNNLTNVIIAAIMNPNQGTEQYSSINLFVTIFFFLKMNENDSD